MFSLRSLTHTLICICYFQAQSFSDLSSLENISTGVYFPGGWDWRGLTTPYLGFPLNTSFWPPPSYCLLAHLVVPSVVPRFWSWPQIDLFRLPSSSVGTWLSAFSPLLIQFPFIHCFPSSKNLLISFIYQASLPILFVHMDLYLFFICYLSCWIFSGSRDKQLCSNCKKSFHHTQKNPG